jgi:hypothetical protein
MRAAILAAVLAAVAGAGAAQTVDGASAQRQLFPTRGVQIAVSRSLSAEQRAIVEELAKEADRTGQSFRYYGSIAWSPAEGMTGQSIRGAFNYHSTDAADREAVSACNAAGGSGNCQVAAHILPRGYEPGRVQLSYDATRFEGAGDLARHRGVEHGGGNRHHGRRDDRGLAVQRKRRRHGRRLRLPGGHRRLTWGYPELTDINVQVRTVIALWNPQVPDNTAETAPEDGS